MRYPARPFYRAPLHAPPVEHLFVRKANPSIADLLANDSILFSEVFNSVLLALVHPACKHRSDEAKRIDPSHSQLFYRQPRDRRIEFLDITSAEARKRKGSIRTMAVHPITGAGITRIGFLDTTASAGAHQDGPSDAGAEREGNREMLAWPITSLLIG